MFLINNLLIPDHPDTKADANGNAHTPIHANSHASMVSDPMSKLTSPTTLNALRDHGLLMMLISALTAPTPHGDDGELEGDTDFEEKIVRYDAALSHRFMIS